MFDKIQLVKEKLADREKSRASTKVDNDIGDIMAKKEKSMKD
jgi:hypothetical protein